MQEYRNRLITSYKRRLRESVEVIKDVNLGGNGYGYGQFDCPAPNQLPVTNKIQRKIDNIFDDIIWTKFLPILEKAADNNHYLVSHDFENMSVKTYFDDVDHGYNKFSRDGEGALLYWIPITGHCLGEYDSCSDNFEEYANNIIDEVAAKIPSIFDGVANRVKLTWDFNNADLEYYIEDNIAVWYDEDNPKWDEMFNNQPDSGIDIGICIEASNDLIKSLE